MKNLLFSFKGRIGRKAYWLGFVINLLIFLVPLIIFCLFSLAIFANEEIDPYASPVYIPDWIRALDDNSNKIIGTVIMLPSIIAWLWSLLAISAKRLRDFKVPGWVAIFLMLSFFAFYGLPYLIISIIIGSIKSTSALR